MSFSVVYVSGFSGSDKTSILQLQQPIYSKPITSGEVASTFFKSAIPTIKGLGRDIGDHPYASVAIIAGIVGLAVLTSPAVATGAVAAGAALGLKALFWGGVALSTGFLIKGTCQAVKAVKSDDRALLGQGMENVWTGIYGAIFAGVGKKLELVIAAKNIGHSVSTVGSGGRIMSALLPCAHLPDEMAGALKFLYGRRLVKSSSQAAGMLAPSL